MSDLSEQSCGYVAILGLANAGKSTLVNALVGNKVSIVSKKVHTTRCRILGIAVHGSAQMILMDTPGVFSPKQKLDKAMVGAAWDAVSEADIVVHLVDCSKSRSLDHNRDMMSKLPQNKPCVLVLNKVDQIKKPELLALAQSFSDQFDYDAVFMVSALKNQGLDDLQKHLTKALPKTPWMFDEDQISDVPMRFMAAEIVREKIFHQLHKELPYAVMIETETWEPFDNGSLKIDQIVYVQRDTQKAIVLGKGGSRIKAIGEAARKELEELLETRVHLKLFVKVQKDWHERSENFSLIGLHSF